MYLRPHCQAVTVWREHKEVEGGQKLWEDAQSEWMEMGAKSTSSVETSCEFKSLPLVCALDVLTSRQQVGAQVLLVLRN